QPIRSGPQKRPDGAVALGDHAGAGDAGGGCARGGEQVRADESPLAPWAEARAEGVRRGAACPLAPVPLSEPVDRHPRSSIYEKAANEETPAGLGAEGVDAGIRPGDSVAQR